MKQNLYALLGGLLILSQPMATHAQQTEKMMKTETDSILAMMEKLRQDSIMWEKQLSAVTIKGTRSQVR